MDPLRFVRSDFGDLEQYVPVKPLDVLAAEIGMPASELVKLDANENLHGPHPAVRSAIAGADLNIYPDPDQHRLRGDIARYLAVSPDEIVAGAGADDLIDILLRLCEPRAIVTAPPSFGMYGFLARLGGAEVVPVARGEGFAVDIAGIEAAVRAGATMVFLASPNNPTGNSLSASEVERLAALEALVVIDEAYVEFGGNSCVPAMARHANLVVLRTFSKWAALAGLRVGYAVVDRELARRMMAIKQPYNVNVAADVAARAALAHRAEIAEDVACIVAERERLFRALEAIPWLTPFPSEANFVLAAVDGRDARAVRDSLRRRGILIRHYDVPELQGFIRISAGRPEDTDRLLAALEELDL